MHDTSTNDQPTRRKRGPKPGTAAAKRGGETARDKLGSAHFREIGHKGGVSNREKHGLEQTSER